MSSIPTPRKPWRRLPKRERNRLLNQRAKWRQENNRSTYEKIGSWVRSIRTRMKKSQPAFARLLGVSVITVCRWELGYGYAPSENPRRSKRGRKLPSNMQRLRNLEATLDRLKQENLEMED